MAETTQVTTFADLVRDLQHRVRSTTGVTATENIAKRLINVALQDMHLGNDYRFPWCERHAYLRTQTRSTTGTLSVDRGSSSLTGTDTAWNTNNDFGVANVRVGGKMTINGRTEPYEITAVASDTSATIGTPFVGADVSGGNYVYFEDEYALESDFLRPVDATTFDLNGYLSIMPRDEFYRRYRRNSIPGKPTAVMLIDKDFSGSTSRVRRLVMAPPPDNFYLFEYRYVTAHLAVSSAGTTAANLSADTDEPIVPLRYRHAIVFHALYHWYRDRKDDTRSNEAKNEYTDIILRATADVEHGARTPKVMPNMGHYAAAARFPWRRSGRRRRYDLNGHFDRLE